jgi:crotonobetaine/carnitine-CoA ligase
VLRDLLDRWAQESATTPFAVLPGGRRVSYGELRAAVRRTAAALQRLGVAQGDPVLVWLPNGSTA